VGEGREGEGMRKTATDCAYRTKDGLVAGFRKKSLKTEEKKVEGIRGRETGRKGGISRLLDDMKTSG